MRVAGPPEKRKTNEALITSRAGALGVRPAAVPVVAGRDGCDETIEVEVVSNEELARWLAGAAGAA